MLRFQHLKRSSGRFRGLLLLALPLSGIALLPSRVLAQPALTPPAKKSRKPLSPEQRAAFDAITKIAHIQSICGSRIDLKMQNVTLEDVVARIQRSLPNQTLAVEVRGARPVHVSFDLKEARVGEVLTPVAELAGCHLFVFGKGLVIAPMNQLTQAERLDLLQRRGGRWDQDASIGEHRGWTERIALPQSAPDQKGTLNKIAVIAQATNVCGNTVDLKMENASLQDVVARIKQMLPNQAVRIEVRGDSPVRVSFDFKGINVGNLLTPVAGLAGCKLYVFGSGLLIAPPSQLTKGERLDFDQIHGGEWAENVDSGQNDDAIRNADGLKMGGWDVQVEAQRLFSKAIAQEITGSDAKVQPPVSVKTRFGNFSPDGQAMLQQIADWSREAIRVDLPGASFLHLTSNSPIEVDTSSPEKISIGISAGESDSKDGGMTIDIFQP